MTKFQQLLSLTLLLFTSSALAQDISNDMDSLGRNAEIVERARALDPQNRVRIVQNRVVDRYNRLEIALRGGLVSGGETYLETSEYGGNLAFHFTPRWSVGASVNTYRYSLTSEGEKVFDEAERKSQAGHTDYNIPQIVYPKNSAQLNLSWYPIYGKTNLFDISTAQFDIYVQGGVGQIQLENPYENSELPQFITKPIYSISTGLGLWLTQHLSTRLELRHEMFSDEVITGPRDRSWTTLSTSIGFLL